MAKQFTVGSLNFSSKKEALQYYKDILNSYEKKQKVEGKDFVDVCELFKLHVRAEEKIGCGIKEIIVDAVDARYNTKAFRIIRNDSSSEVISYIYCINGNRNLLQKFSCACRDLVAEDIRLVKYKYFRENSKGGRVKCQETNELCNWNDLVIDHRQPNTFSVIVDRFIELNGIELERVEYDEIIDSVFVFKDRALAESFRKYHKQKANLRIVKKIKNSSRTHQSRISRQNKDLTIE